MFAGKTYQERRHILKQNVKSGIILILGNEESPINSHGNCYPFRQDNSFLYYAGLDTWPGMALMIDIDNDLEILFADDITVEDEIWMGKQPKVAELAARSNISKTEKTAALEKYIQNALSKKRSIHYLPACRSNNVQKLEKLLGISADFIDHYSSEQLIKAVVKQRSIKSGEELSEIEKALDISHEMYCAILENMAPGMYERELAGMIQGIILQKGSKTSFPPIVTVNGKTLHNEYYDNKLKLNDLLLVDTGAKSPEHYSSDITRTYPVGGKFTDRQKGIYNIVLKMMESAFDMIKPGVLYRDVHLESARVAVAGLKELGVMKGNIEDAVKEGAHALFYPHGLGHMIGLGCHDMEGLGEDYVGYDEKIFRCEQFGLSALRLARELKKGFVLTVEPGIYFIPGLIDLWESEKKHAEFINFNEVNKYRDFEGIRVEDDIVVTDSGMRILGRPIPKTVEEIERYK